MGRGGWREGRAGRRGERKGEEVSLGEVEPRGGDGWAGRFRDVGFEGRMVGES